MEYQAIQTLTKEKGYPIKALCELIHITRSAYYRWLKNPTSANEKRNQEIAEKVKQIHKEHPDMGYRRIRDELEVNYGIDVNDKRILRINRKLQIKSTIKYGPSSCTKHAKDPAFVADNVLGRKFHADAPNEKWVTDISEFKYYTGVEVHKVYLSAILDLYDRRIVSFVISDHNDNPLVLDTFDQAVAKEPDACPLFHSDRGFQYTSYDFHDRLKNFGMTQSMSRVAHCIDNGPMEGFWGILKRERYYGKRFTDRGELVDMITDYIDYYNYRRLQRKMNIMTPMQFHELYYKNVA